MEKTRKVPLRQCLGCREMKPKRELVRIVRLPEAAEGERVTLDLNGKTNGRGAYICPDANCLKRVRKSGAVSRQLGVAIPTEIWEQMENQIANK